MTSLSFMECLASPQSDCFASPSFWAPLALLAILTAVGSVAWRQEVVVFRRLRRRSLLAAASVLTVSFAAISTIAVVDPEAITTTDTSPLSQTAWAVALTSLGAGVTLLAGALSLALGGRLAKLMSRRAAHSNLRLIIAIDGPAASGKGTLAKRIAQHFSLPCLDTGLLYRAVARDVVDQGQHLNDVAAAVAAAQRLNAATLDDPALRGPAAGDAASIVARIPAVRAALLDYQRRFANQPDGAVLDGRDIGTIVCPDAPIKIYVTATPQERARRRHIEHTQRGETVAYETVLADILQRDARDSSRDIAPMEPAADAARLDTTSLDADAAFREALKIIAAKKA